ncbi:protoporphyrinogen/coproporphyrinogen oxidase [Microbacterium sp.]|uniref:protoporphyrinogen/coproporphyrinogen oxidase n=1 Tax=Microbacterium sp. TaxID=51671 RepID=UPI0039E66237
MTLDGIAVDLVADSFPMDAAPLAAVIDELGLRAQVEPAATETAWVAFRAGGSSGALRRAPLPGPSAAAEDSAALAGIPANPWAENVRRIIGWNGAWRAYLDRLRPPLTIGRESSLGALVAGRMGARVRDRLVAPLTHGVYGVAPEAIDVDRAVPGLSAALTRTGSLAGGADQLLAARPAADGARLATLRGGMSDLVGTLAARLADLDADVRTGARVTELARVGDRWVVRVTEDTAAASETPPAAAPDAVATPTADGPDAVATPAVTVGAASLTADAVIVATGAASAVALLGTAGAEVAETAAPVRDVVTLVVDAAGLDAPEAGTAAAVYPAAGAAEAAGVVNATAMWPSVAEAAGPDRWVLRVSLPAADSARRDGPLLSTRPENAGTQPAGSTGTGRLDATDAPDAADAPGAPEPRAQEQAAAQAALLLGAAPLAVRACAQRRVVLEEPASVLGHAERTALARAAVAARPGLTAVGAWLSGGGIAAVVADAIGQADAVRRSVLWGSDDPS